MGAQTPSQKQYAYNQDVYTDTDQVLNQPVTSDTSLDATVAGMTNIDLLTHEGFRPLFIPGDMNFDGNLDERDVALLNHALHRAPPADGTCEKRVYDVNEDGEINDKDVAALATYVQYVKDGSTIPLAFAYVPNGNAPSASVACPIFALAVNRQSCTAIGFRPLKSGVTVAYVPTDSTPSMDLNNPVLPPIRGSFGDSTGAPETAATLSLGTTTYFSIQDVSSEHYLFDVDVSGTSLAPRYSLDVNGFGLRTEDCASPAATTYNPEPLLDYGQPNDPGTNTLADTPDGGALTKSITRDPSDRPVPAGIIEAPNDVGRSTLWQTAGSPAWTRLASAQPAARTAAPSAAACRTDPRSGSRVGYGLAIMLLSDWHLRGPVNSANDTNTNFGDIVAAMRGKFQGSKVWNVSDDDRMTSAPNRELLCTADWWSIDSRPRQQSMPPRRHLIVHQTGKLGDECVWHEPVGGGGILYMGRFTALGLDYDRLFGRWSERMLGVQRDLDALVAGFNRDIQTNGAAGVFFYIVAHGSPQTTANPYGCWSTGVSGIDANAVRRSVLLDRGTVLQGLRNAASAAATCNFTAIDDSCYAQTAKYGREQAYNCMDRPARYVSPPGPWTVNLWISVSHAYRVSPASEGFKRGEEIAAHLNKVETRPAEFGSSYFHTGEFGDVYWDFGNNDPTACPWPVP